MVFYFLCFAPRYDSLNIVFCVVTYTTIYPIIKIIQINQNNKEKWTSINLYFIKEVIYFKVKIWRKKNRMINGSIKKIKIGGPKVKPPKK